MSPMNATNQPINNGPTNKPTNACTPSSTHFLFSALAVFACVYVAGINPSAHHSRSLCSQAAFALRAHQPPACFVLLACIRRYRLQILFSALAVFACVYVAGINPSAHHSRSLCSQAAFALRAHQPLACFVCLRVSDDTACSFYFLHSLFSLVFTWLVLIHRPITRAACAFRLHSHRFARCPCDVVLFHLPITRTACASSAAAFASVGYFTGLQLASVAS